MKLSWKEIEPFVKKPDAKARAILIYGPDDGLVKERSSMIGASVVSDLNDPFNVAALSADILSDDPARLSDEANAMSMMGGARLIRVEDAGDKLTVLLKEYLENPSSENLVVLEAGELGPRSTLRALFEKSPNAAAVPCYVDDEKGVQNLIRQTLSEAGYTIQGDANAWLAQNITGDRLRVRGEIEKLIVYMGKESKTVQMADVMAACGEAGDQSLDDLLYAIGAGKTETALRAYNKLLGEGVAMITILRSMQGHFRKLHYIKSLMKDGAGTDEAMKKLQPPIFFKNVDPFKAQLRRWGEDKLLSILGRLSQVEAQSKQTGTPVETLGSQVILSLSAQ